MLVTIAMPAYDEVLNLERVAAEALAALAATGVSVELLIVGDGSTDGTGALADEIARRAATPRPSILFFGTLALFSGAAR